VIKGIIIAAALKGTFGHSCTMRLYPRKERKRTCNTKVRAANDSGLGFQRHISSYAIEQIPSQRRVTLTPKESGLQQWDALINFGDLELLK
jgi:hypothetical protein